jgi:hypothetical protein
MVEHERMYDELTKHKKINDDLINKKNLLLKNEK